MIVNVRYDNTVIGSKRKQSLEIHTDVWVLKYSRGKRKKFL